ncbi:MAG: hypothetical protein ACFCVK_24415 [Acidimicrobiales bacterium]
MGTSVLIDRIGTLMAVITVAALPHVEHVVQRRLRAALRLAALQAAVVVLAVFAVDLAATISGDQVGSLLLAAGGGLLLLNVGELRPKPWWRGRPPGTSTVG